MGPRPRKPSGPAVMTAQTGRTQDCTPTKHAKPSQIPCNAGAISARNRAVSSSPGRDWPARRQAMGHSEYDPGFKDRRPWNAGRKLGAKRALKPQQVWAIGFWLDRERRVRDRAMFDLAIDSKLRGCDIVKIRIGDLISGGQVRSRAIVVQRKTGRPVQFER